MTENHGRALSLLSRIAASSLMPHAILLTGPHTSLKVRLAYAFARWLFHDAKGNLSKFLEEECVCVSCNQVARGIHPDFLCMEDTPMKIEQVRDLKQLFRHTPFFASRKIAIIHRAETMRQEAANAFLKLLEEPQGNALFLLLSPSRGHVLPTIASRAAEIPVAAEFPRSVRYEDVISIFENGLLCEKFQVLKNYTLENKHELLELFDAWLLRLRERLYAPDPARTLFWLKKIFYAKYLMSATNTNPQLTLEEMFVRFRSYA